MYVLIAPCGSLYFILLMVAFSSLYYVYVYGSSSSSFNTEKLHHDEGYFPAHAWHDNLFFFINFHFLQFLLIFIFYNFY